MDIGKTITYRAGYKYQLASTYILKTGIKPQSSIRTDFVELLEDGELWVHAGYAWDGASGPTMDTPDSMRGSLVHDALYQLMRCGLLNAGHKDEVDELFRRILIEDGMSVLRANIWFHCVSSYAGFATQASAERRLMVAPEPNV